MRLGILVASMLMLSGGASFAQDAQGCSRIEDSLQRLTCFDKLFPKADGQAAATTSAPEVKPSPEHRWEIAVECRLTVAEKNAVEGKAAERGLTVTSYVYQRLTQGRVKLPRANPEIGQLVIELNRVGVNLNQIARAANSGKPLPPEFPRVLASLEAVLHRAVEGLDE